MNTPRIPQFLTDLRNRLRNMKGREKRTFLRNRGHIISSENIQFYIRRDARKAANHNEAVRTGYMAKMERVHLGKGKNTLAGIRFSEA